MERLAAGRRGEHAGAGALSGDVRAEFALDREVVYLNHGAFGACPRPVLDEYRRRQLELERNPVDFLGRRLDGLLADVRTRLAEYVGADGDDLVLVPNATAALNVVARSLRLEAGDEVLTTEHEYGAADILWRFVCRRTGARYVRRSLSLPVSSPEDVVESVWSGVTERTRVLFLSHVTSPTALVLPVGELCRRARAAGILAIVDGAHGPGQVPVDLRSLDADAYAGNCHKWLCSPKGAGFLWVRRELQPDVDSLVVGWGWADEEAGFVERNQRQGTGDPAAHLAVPAAIDFLGRNRWDEVRAGCQALAREARDRLATVPGIEPFAGDSSWLAQMVSVELPPCEAEAVGLRLAREHGMEVYAKAWEGRPVLRLSFQGYNTHDDLERLLAALPRVLRTP